ncbi:MAG: response regulator transcription factor [Candidatus Eremiobacteraeota bacterium]|nr:response regulator transcription factor [Candidatus Eremiobacteraeota bacterium]MBV9409501.1 response regulator transcription factor [Candidatus Eremiobacteraeota bacterium]
MESAFPRVLVVDDEDAICELLLYGLGRQGFDVRVARDGREALRVMEGWSPEAIVLDVMLPGIDGLSMLPAFRRVSDVPILMLTARAATADKVTALTIGADDYVAKPFEMEELVARLRAALRRPRLQLRETIAYGDLSIDVGRRAVTRAGRRIELTTREFDLLLTLAREPERIFTRTELLDLVWGASRDIAPATVETYISHLRAKIDVEDAPRLIHTMRGAGYALRREAS